MDIILIIIGIGIVLRGADRLTEGAVAIARRLKMTELVIGLTVVALGTSMPELCVSLVSALNGTTAMAIGNVVGSNIFNVLLIVGVCAVIHPMSVSMEAIRRDLPFALVATVALILFLADGALTKGESFILFASFIAYMAYTLKTTRAASASDAVQSSATTATSGLTTKASSATAASSAQPSPSTGKFRLPAIFHNPAFCIVAGLAELILGSNLFVSSATSLATSLGVSDAVIGITILGAGTSLPELATSVVAAMKGSTSMALGNVIGSCTFNVLMILGLTGIIVPLVPDGITTVDLATLFVSMILLWFFSFTKMTMARWEGAVLAVCFIAYMGFLIHNA